MFKDDQESNPLDSQPDHDDNDELDDYTQGRGYKKSKSVIIKSFQNYNNRGVIKKDNDLQVIEEDE